MTMTVAELIAELEQYEDNTPVFFAYNYGDRSNTLVAAGVRHTEELPVKHSEYHGMDKVLDPEEDEENADVPLVVVLR